MPMRQYLIYLVHEHHSHAGIAQTYFELRIRYWWPSLRKHVFCAISACNDCALVRSHKQARQVGQDFHRFLARRFDTVAVDLAAIPPQFQANHGNTILVCVDEATMFTVYARAESATSASLAGCFTRFWISYFGAPSTVRSDNAVYFKSQFVEEISSIIGLRRVNSLAYNPAANGLCEGRVRLIKRMLKLAVLRGEVSSTALDLYLSLATSVANVRNLTTLSDCTSAALVFEQADTDADICSLARDFDVKGLLSSLRSVLSEADCDRNIHLVDSSTEALDRRIVASHYLRANDGIVVNNLAYYRGEGPFRIVNVDGNKVTLEDALGYSFHVAIRHVYALQPSTPVWFGADVATRVAPAAVDLSTVKGIIADGSVHYMLFVMDDKKTNTNCLW
ncbi:hypothetical protein FOZ60_010669 [Perkinsus olseni]|uniref:Integrase catalytic domain-containing protein n=1 Tax=Perkinsus olseni TaxID=32597 RepID=A0A7J6NEW6_PEROL|nr:hypothetical protein FOZ60_010669 [Perkinsus olseni]